MEVAGMINDESRRKLREMNLGEIISGLEAQQSLQDDALVGIDVLAAGQVSKKLPVQPPAFIQDALHVRLREAKSCRPYEPLNLCVVLFLIDIIHQPLHPVVKRQPQSGSFISAFLTCSWNTVTVLPSQAARRSC